jgi:acyl-CoA synthetase (AMP-forming)/AMP-acid ligase II
LGAIKGDATSDRASLPGAILQTLERAPASVRYSFRAHAEGVETLDAAAMRRRIAGYAMSFRRSGIRRRSVTPILAASSSRVWAAFVGAMAADLIPCILPAPTFKTHMPTYVRNLSALTSRYGSTFVIAGAAYGAMIAPIVVSGGGRLDLLSLEGLDEPSNDVEPALCGGVDVAFLQHSSGSTGVPRGVALSHRAVLGHLEAYGRSIRFDPPHDRIVSWLPLYHDMGLLTSFLLPLLGGASCDTVPPGEWILDPLSILRLITEQRSTLSWWPNFTFALLAQRARPSELAQYDLTSVRLLVNCGEPVLRSSREAFAQTFAPCGLDPRALQASYGMAENVFAATQSQGDAPLQIAVKRDSLDFGRTAELCDPTAADARWVMSSGRPIESVRLKVVDESLADVGEGRVGEMMVAGPSLFNGYYLLPEATVPVLQNGWYRTGDIGFLWQAELFALGRKSDLIIVGGRKFYPNDVEHLVNEIPGVKDGRVVAFGVMREEKGTEDVVVLAESTEHADRAGVQRLRKEIKARVLQRLDCPVDDAVILPPQSLIKTTSGKIARRDNRRLYVEQLQKRNS